MTPKTIPPILTPHVKQAIGAANQAVVKAAIDVASLRLAIGPALTGLEQATLDRLRTMDLMEFAFACSGGQLLFRPRVPLAQLHSSAPGAVTFVYTKLLGQNQPPPMREELSEAIADANSAVIAALFLIAASEHPIAPPLAGVSSSDIEMIKKQEPRHYALACKSCVLLFEPRFGILDLAAKDPAASERLISAMLSDVQRLSAIK